MNQNYFHHNGEFYKQTQGLAMGAPTSPILAEIYMQYLEHNDIYDILIHHKIITFLDMSTIDSLYTIANRGK
jgi:hypothetical protein